jgi:hypothetical protein
VSDSGPTLDYAVKPLPNQATMPCPLVRCDGCGVTCNDGKRELYGLRRVSETGWHERVAGFYCLECAEEWGRR